MSDVVLYTTMMCPYCYRAKQLFEDKGIAYKEIDVGMDAKMRQEMTERSNGGRTVPQIFIDDRHIGGCDDLYALDRAGKLDPLLQAG